MSGTSLGGWLVLEPWLTPSLFYQFLGADERYGPDLDNIRLKTGMDQKSFCTALGPKEANRQLRRHWKLWLTEEHIQLIAKTGSTHVRIPVGDWMWEPYDIYDEVEHGVRCNDGAIEELNRALKLIEKYGMKALIDMHAWIGSQNGLDNSGETKFVKWAQEIPEQGTYAPIGTFEALGLQGRADCELVGRLGHRDAIDQQGPLLAFYARHQEGRRAILKEYCHLGPLAC